jgi:hypothetical protein
VKRGEGMPVIVTAGEGFTDLAGEFHPWGQELTWPDTPERAKLLTDGTLREDDRMKPQPADAATK